MIALNAEILALVRAGVPLERGLLDLGDDLRGCLGAIARALGERLDRGESLPDALQNERARIPEVYRAVVEAGLRAGHLPVALEGLARYARNLADLRRAVGLALLYPVMILILAYALFVVFVLMIAPRLQGAFEAFRLPALGFVTVLTRLGETVSIWGPIVPLVLMLLGLGWLRSGQASALQSGVGSWGLSLFPWMRGLLTNVRAASFAELLALLVEHGVPLPEAIELAADASGDARLRNAARDVAARLRRGDALAESLEPAESEARSASPQTLPPMLRWLMRTGQRQGDLVSALRHAARIYRDRAFHRAELIRIFLPTMMLFFIGVTATFLYVLTLFVPLSVLLKELSHPLY